MQSAEIKSRLKNFFEEEFPNPGAALTDDTNLLNDWFVDSFGIVNTTLFLEENFGIEISRADINATTFRSIETLSRYVAENKGYRRIMTGLLGGSPISRKEQEDNDRHQLRVQPVDATLHLFVIRLKCCVDQLNPHSNTV